MNFNKKYNLDKLYYDREEELSKLNVIDKIFMDNVIKLSDKIRMELYNMNLDDNTVEKILDLLEELNELRSRETSYYQMKYYKAGFTDSIHLFISCF